MIETAIVLFPCLLFMFAIFEYGRVVMLRQLLANATREAARYAVWNTNTQPTPNLQTYMTAYLAGQPLTITSFNAHVGGLDGLVQHHICLGDLLRLSGCDGHVSARTAVEIAGAGHGGGIGSVLAIGLGRRNHTHIDGQGHESTEGDQADSYQG
jgi:hypothetical protein